MEERKTAYLCDPEKNKGCKKEFCAYNPDAELRACISTTEKEFARLDFAGKPCENPDMNGTTLERVETNFEEQGPVEIPAEYLDAEEMGLREGWYKDPKWANLAQEIMKKAEEGGDPWFAGLFNPKIFQEAARGEETK